MEWISRLARHAAFIVLPGFALALAGCPNDQSPAIKTVAEQAYGCDGTFSASMVGSNSDIRDSTNVSADVRRVDDGRGHKRTIQILRLDDPFSPGSVTSDNTRHVVSPSGCAAAASAVGVPVAFETADPEDSSFVDTVVKEDYIIRCDPHRKSTITFGFSTLAGVGASNVSVTPDSVSCTNGDETRVSETVTFVRGPRDIFTAEETSIELIDSQMNTCNLIVPFPAVTPTPNPFPHRV